MRTHMTHWLMALSLWGVTAHVGAQEMDLSSLVKLSKQMRAKELAESLGRNNASPAPASPGLGAAPPPPPPPPPPEPPVLKALMGVNEHLQAEVVYDGQTLTVSHGMAVAKGLGPWKNSYVFTDGVLLTTTPVNLNAVKDKMPEVGASLQRQPICQWLQLTDKQCLFLVPTPVVARSESTAANKGGVFQDQVRSLVSQTPTPPVSYAIPPGASPGSPPGTYPPAGNAAGGYPPGNTGAAAYPNTTPSASSESTPVRAKVFPK